MPLLAEFNAQQAMMLAGLGILTFMLIRRTRRYQQKVKREARRAEKEKRALAETSIDLDQQQPLLDAPDSVLRWQVEMHETARELQGKLDSKLRALQLLIAQAEQSSAKLQGLIDAANETCESGTQIPRIPDLASNWDSQVELPPLEKCSEIYGLADDGQTAAAISGQVGLPIGEIELILSLRV